MPNFTNANVTGSTKINTCRTTSPTTVRVGDRLGHRIKNLVVAVNRELAVSSIEKSRQLKHRFSHAVYVLSMTVGLCQTVLTLHSLWSFIPYSVRPSDTPLILFFFWLLLPFAIHAYAFSLCKPSEWASGFCFIVFIFASYTPLHLDSHLLLFFSFFFFLSFEFEQDLQSALGPWMALYHLPFGHHNFLLTGYPFSPMSEDLIFRHSLCFILSIYLTFFECCCHGLLFSPLDLASLNSFCCLLVFYFCPI